MKKLFIIALCTLILSSCNSLFDLDKNSKSSYFPLSVGNKWIYEVDDDGTLVTQTIEVTSENNGLYTIDIKIEDGESESTSDTSESYETSETTSGDSFFASYKIKASNGCIYTENDQMIVSGTTEAFNSTTMIWLFKTYYSPDQFSKQLSFSGSEDKITCEFTGRPSNTYNCSYIFSETFEKETGLTSWIDQKAFNNPYWGMMISTRRGTLKSAIIDGKETNY